MSLPRYRDYIESDIDGVAAIPAHWRVAALSHIGELQTGPFGSQLHSDDYVVGGIPVINPSNISDGRLVPDYTCAISERDAQRLMQYRLNPGEIVVGRRGEMGRCATVADEANGWLCGTGCLRVRLNARATAAFVSAWLRTAHVREALSLHSVGSTMENLNTNILGRIRVPLPSVEEQLRIIAFLDRETAKIDVLIAEQEKLITLLAEKRQATISHAVTRGLDPNARMKDSGVPWLGEIPAHWTLKRLKSFSPSITVGIVVNPSEYVAPEGLPFIYGGDIAEGRIDTEGCRRITAERSASQPKTQLQPGDLLTVRVGAPGVTAVVPESCAGGNCASVMLIRKGAFDSAWLCFAMNSRMVRFQVEVVQYGAAQEQFNIGHALNFWIATPPIEEQEKISELLAQEIGELGQLTMEAEHAIALLKERRSALIAAAVTGQIDVRGTVAELTAEEAVAA